MQAWADVIQPERYKTTAMYQELRGDRGHVDWYHLFVKNYAKLLARFTLWLSMLGRLVTKDRLLRFGTMVEASCVFCREDETLHHRMFECQWTRKIWQQILLSIGYDRSPLGWNQERHWLIGEVRRKDWRRDMLKIAPAECVYGIWRHHNDVIFNNTHVDAHIWKNITYDIFVRSSIHKIVRNHTNIDTLSIVA